MHKHGKDTDDLRLVTALSCLSLCCQ